MSDTTWTTEKEIDFINKLGTFNGVGVQQRNKRICIEGYLKACEHRQKWGDIDKSEVVAFAKECLRQVKKWQR